MKKTLFLLLIVFVLGMMLSSCHQTQSCPAYGDYHQYQRENIY